jgi:hypothetical protein
MHMHVMTGWVFRARITIQRDGTPFDFSDNLLDHDIPPGRVADLENGHQNQLTQEVDQRRVDWQCVRAIY